MTMHLEREDISQAEMRRTKKFFDWNIVGSVSREQIPILFLKVIRYNEESSQSGHEKDHTVVMLQ